MAIQLPKLPYARDALEPHMSRETLDYHYGKHHKKYVDTANKLIAGTEFEDMATEQIIRQASGAMFNNVAQAWNHSFFWQCLTPDYEAPSMRLSESLVRQFGSLADFEDLFTKTALKTFGSGWAWLVRTGEGSLKVVSTANAGNPLTQGQVPLLACDVWEHAYYLDYRNSRADYLQHYWSLVNWEFVESRLWNEVSAAAA